MEGCVGEGQIEFRPEATCKVESSPDLRLARQELAARPSFWE